MCRSVYGGVSVFVLAGHDALASLQGVSCHSGYCVGGVGAGASKTGALASYTKMFNCEIT